MAKSWRERANDMHAQNKKKWKEDSVFKIYEGLSDSSEGVNAAAIDALMKFAMDFPNPVRITPGDLLKWFFSKPRPETTIRPLMLEFLFTHGKKDVDNTALKILNLDSKTDDFAEFVEIVKKHNKTDLLKKLNKANLSAAKQQIIDDTL